MKKISACAVTLAALLGSPIPRGAAQDLSELGDLEERDAYTVNLAFSGDEKILREIRMVSPASPGQFWRVRAISRDISTRKVRRVFDLAPDTCFFSGTTDGRIAVISENRDRPDDRPPKWLHKGCDLQSRTNLMGHPEFVRFRCRARKDEPSRLVSAYSTSGPADGPQVVTIYDWRRKRLVAERSRGFSAGGIDSGGITEDGKIAFSNNRTGTEIVEATTGRLLVDFGPNAARSPDGKWIVELPGYLHGWERIDSVVINGLDGKRLGRLDELKFSEDGPGDSWFGQFCGTTARLVAWNPREVVVIQLPSGKKLASFTPETWRDKDLSGIPNLIPTVVACSWTGKRVAIRSGARLTLHQLE